MNLFGLRIFRPRLSEEALFAYYHKLPNKIQVRWFRDGKYIVGEVNDGSKVFFTQGKNAEDFINMVNESLIASYNIPYDYFDALKSVKQFQPKPEERIRLENLKVLEGSFGSKKIEEKALKFA